MILIKVFFLVAAALANVGDAADSESVVVKDSLYYGRKMFNWIESMPGGFVSKKIEVRALNPEDPNSPLGVFAVKDLKNDEVLAAIPQRAVLGTGRSDDLCPTTRKLLKEYQKGDKSFYAIYIEYLMDHSPRGVLPASWSQPAKDLLTRLIGEEQPPPLEDLFANSFQDDCNGSGDPDEEHAYLTAVQRAWDGKLIPILDLVNHRNGKWFNTDSSEVSDQNTDKTLIYTIREVKAGEQLYVSHSHCFDCEGLEDTLLTPHLIPDYAFIEDYPQRWAFDIQGELEFQVDEKSDGSGELEVTWIQTKLEEGPTHTQMNYLRGQYKRLKGLNETVKNIVEKLESASERNLILRYYNELTTALKAAMKETPVDPDNLLGHSNRVDAEEVCVDPNGSTETCSYERYYDDLEEYDETWDFSQVCNHDNGEDITMHGYDDLEDYHSVYQHLDFYHDKSKQDTCMNLNGVHHVCSSLRPHYHEIFVHLPARYLDNVKCVAFIGGGDNMLVHEILKYPSLELVLGLELDQSVVRKSFKHFGASPEFQNEKVEWWFGDAAKSLRMIPRDYYGSFDLVIVDVLNEVIQMLKVTDDISILDAALLLLNKDGVIVSNDDYGVLLTELPTKNKVLLAYESVPHWCQLFFVMGSPTVDFITKNQTDHRVGTEVVEAVNDNNDPFVLWQDYWNDADFVDHLCKELGEEDDISTEDPAFGVMMIIDAEKTTLPLEATADLQNTISKALLNAGLTELRVMSDESFTNKDGDYSLAFLLSEGYVVVRASPSHRYCGFDVFLWNSFDKQETAKAELSKAVGSELGKSLSSFRIITGGISGLPRSVSGDSVGPRVTRECDEDEVLEPKHEEVSSKKVANELLSETISMVPGEESTVMVLCSEPCSDLEFLANQNPNVKFVALPVCPILSVVNATGNDSEMMQLVSCEVETLRNMEELVEKNGKLDGILFTTEVPKAMAQILHKILSHKPTRLKVLSESYIVAIVTADDEKEKDWEAAFVQRFRLDFEIFDPAYTTDILLEGEDLVVRLRLFSCGDSEFLWHFSSLVKRMEENTPYRVAVGSALNGILNYNPEFEPAKEFTLHDYVDESTKEHWNSQKPLGYQTIFQLEWRARPKVPMRLLEAFKKTVSSFPGIENVEFEVVEDLGDGILALAMWSEGSAVMLWGGESDVQVNLFTSSPDRRLHVNFLGSLTLNKPKLVPTVHDEQPRGVGRVISLPEDLGQRPLWF